MRNAHKSQDWKDWAGQKLGAWSIQVSHISGKNLVSWAITVALQGLH